MNRMVPNADFIHSGGCLSALIGDISTTRTLAHPQLLDNRSIIAGIIEIPWNACGFDEFDY